MRLQVIYTIEKKVEVQIEVSDTKIIKAFEENGGINSDSDFKGNSDKRWDAEQIAYEQLTSGTCSEGDENITDRSIIIIE